MSQEDIPDSTWTENIWRSQCPNVGMKGTLVCTDLYQLEVAQRQLIL